MKKNIGLFIGRFQPFHKGHLYIIRKTLKDYVDNLVIGVGTANRVDRDNPIPFEVRKKMIEETIRREKWGNKIVAIIPINDFLESDDKWLSESLKILARFRDGRGKDASLFDVVLGNNEWVNGIFEKAGYPVQRLGYYRRYLYEGEKIRKLVREGKKWEDRVPGYLLHFLPKGNVWNFGE